MPERHGTNAGSVQLPYGGSRIDFSFDPERFRVLRPPSSQAAELDDDALSDRLDEPIDSDPLERVAGGAESVCIVVPDITRASGSARVASLLLSHLAAAGVATGRIEFLVGAGTHRPPTAPELAAILGPETARRMAVHWHDARDASQHAAIGTTSRGTPVVINRRLVEADRVILVGALGFHYFAGFSGGRKAVLPACASERSIQTNHLLAFDATTLARAAGVESGRLDGNPVSEDMEEAARIFGPSFLVNTVLNGSNRITALYAGDWFAAHRRGCADYRASHAIEVAERRPVVVTSCGGSPRDINMIQSHKALEHARFVLEEGGDLVLVAECPEGLGRPDFLDWFVPGGSTATARMLVGNYKLNGQTAWGIRWKSERYQVRLVSGLDPAVVRKMGMIPYPALDRALADCAKGPGYIIPDALGTLPVVPAQEAPRAPAGAR